MPLRSTNPTCRKEDERQQKDEGNYMMKFMALLEQRREDIVVYAKVEVVSCKSCHLKVTNS